MKISTPEEKEKQRIRQAKWRAANLEKVRKQARDSVRKKRENDPEAYRIKCNEIAKRSREKHLEERRIKEREYSRINREKNKETYNLKQREYRSRNKEKFEQYYENGKERNKIWARIKLLKKYNLTPETYNEMLLKQEGKCAICEFIFENEKPNIDHCHDTGKVRSLLCSPCNIVLGHLEKINKRIPNIQERFTEYLKIHSNRM